MEPLSYSVYDSPIGLLTIVVSPEGLLRLGLPLPDARPNLPEDLQGVPDSQHNTLPIQTELEEYFAGQRREFSFPLDLRGTEFQMRCWHALLEIPYGRTRTYADIARAVGCPRGFRAVGMANHDNPIPIVVPCHRVIASDGTLGGYGGGLAMKRKLLELERGNNQ
ncbi:MAG: methylated-DNA--[protein]-cysteine S-methyltransferase [Terriglobales bacterium]